MSEGTELPGHLAYLRFLPDFLFHTDANKARYVARTWVLVMLPSVLLSILVNLIAPNAERIELPLHGAMMPVMILLLVLIGPLIETLLMAPVLLVVNRFAGAGPAVVANAVLWAVLHSLQRPVWGLVVWWQFLILSIAFLTWRPRGLLTAILLVSIVHGLQNSVAAALFLVTDVSGAAPAG